MEKYITTRQRIFFSGQYDATFRKWQEEFAADTERDVDAMIEQLDAEIAAIQ